MTPFDRAIKQANAALFRAAGKPIVYQAGYMEIEIPNALQGSTTAEISDINGVSIRMLQTDWLVPISVMVIDDQPVEPQAGDLIEHFDGEVLHRYEVQNLGTEKCYRISGPLRDRYRIHVRLISELVVEPESESGSE
jgi:hypothetical protein